MPPTIIVTVGRLAAEAEPPPSAAAVGLLPPPDEQAATARAVAHATASAARAPLLELILVGLILGMALLLRVEVGEGKFGRERRSERGRLGAGLRPPGQQPPFEQADQPLGDQRDD